MKALHCSKEAHRLSTVQERGAGPVTWACVASPKVASTFLPAVPPSSSYSPRNGHTKLACNFVAHWGPPDKREEAVCTRKGMINTEGTTRREGGSR